MIDNGLASGQLWAGAWILGGCSLCGWLFLALHMGDSGGVWDSASALALALGVTCSVFSACCALLMAIKKAERRIRQSQSAPHIA
jgi:hypothetical protein